MKLHSHFPQENLGHAASTCEMNVKNPLMMVSADFNYTRIIQFVIICSSHRHLKRS